MSNYSISLACLNTSWIVSPTIEPYITCEIEANPIEQKKAGSGAAIQSQPHKTTTPMMVTAAVIPLSAPASTCSRSQSCQRERQYKRCLNRDFCQLPTIRPLIPPQTPPTIAKIIREVPSWSKISVLIPRWIKPQVKISIGSLAIAVNPCPIECFNCLLEDSPL